MLKTNGVLLLRHESLWVKPTLSDAGMDRNKMKKSFTGRQKANFPFWLKEIYNIKGSKLQDGTWTLQTVMTKPFR